MSLKEKNKESETKSAKTENHHTHGIRHRRKFKDFLFEFIMLFLAITGGFFTENLRESNADRHKEKEYVVSLINDIEIDTANIQRILKIHQKQIKGIDSLLILLNRSVPKNKLQRFYELTFKYLNNYEGFTPRDITMTQLKNSSGLSLIEKKLVSDSIIIYYSDIQYFRDLNEKMNYQLVDEAVKLEMVFLDFNAIENKTWKFFDRRRIREFNNRAIIFKDALSWDNHCLKDIYKEGSSLLKYLKQEYNIKSEIK